MTISQCATKAPRFQSIPSSEEWWHDPLAAESQLIVFYFHHNIVGRSSTSSCWWTIHSFVFHTQLHRGNIPSANKYIGCVCTSRLNGRPDGKPTDNTLWFGTWMDDVGVVFHFLSEARKLDSWLGLPWLDFIMWHSPHVTFKLAFPLSYNKDGRRLSCWLEINNVVWSNFCSRGTHMPTNE